MKKIKFVVPGNPVGYKTTTAKSKWNKRYRSYVSYKELIQFHAKMSGIRLPLVATSDRQIMIRTVAYFSKKRHPDPENVNKGIRDALFYDSLKKKKGDDKQTGGSFDPPLYDKKNPRVVIIIKPYKKKDKKCITKK